MTFIPDTVLNARAASWATAITHVSLHEGDPGPAGLLLEAAGGVPAYTRGEVTYATEGADGPLGALAQPATAGVTWGSATLTPPDGTYTHMSGWTGVTGTDFQGSKVLTAPLILAAQGPIQVSVKVIARSPV